MGENKRKNNIASMFNSIIESSSELAFVKDENFVYICCSVPFAKLAGHNTTSDIVGKTDYDLFDKETADRYRRDDEMLYLNNESIIEKEEMIPSDDGETHYSLTSKHIIRNERGDAVGLYGTGRDITKYRVFDAKMSLVNDSSNAVVVIESVNNNILYKNKAAEEMCMSPYTFENRIKCYQFLYGYDNPCPNCIMCKACENKYQEEEITNHITERKYYIRYKTIWWAEKKAFLAYIHEDTERINNRLQLEANQRAVSLASLNSGISFWNYNLDSKLLTWDVCEATNRMGYMGTIQNVPDYFWETKCLHPDDVEVFQNMYQELFNNAQMCECSVRLKNQNTGLFEWKHIIYSRLYDKAYKDRMAIGFAETVDMQKKMEDLFLYEEKLRHELIKNSDSYFEFNLSTGKIMEHWANNNQVQKFADKYVMIDDFLEKVIYSIIEEDREKTLKALQQEKLLELYQNGESNVKVEYRRRLSNGNYEWMACKTSILMKPGTNEIMAFINIVSIDKERKRQLVKNSLWDDEVDTVSLVNIASNTFLIVKNSEDLIDIEEGTLIAYSEDACKKLFNIIAKEDNERSEKFFDIKNMVHELETNKRSTFIFQTLKKDGEKLYFQSTIYFLDETHEDIIIARRNITKDYRDEIKQKERLKKTLKKAEEAGKAKQEFLARMSHDIRTPLNAIIGINNLLINETDKIKLEKYHRDIDISSQFLLGIINDVLDLSRIEEGKIDLHEQVYSLKEFEESIEVLINPMMKQKGIILKGDYLVKGIPHIMVDKVRYNQILFNLLSNACKYTLSGGTVELNVEQLPTKEGKIGIRHIVRDNGIGMSEEFLKIIFMPFEREKNKHTPEQQGTGLGLTIVKKLVDAMGDTLVLKANWEKAVNL